MLWQLPVVATIAPCAWLLLPGSVIAMPGPLAWPLVLFVVRFPLRIFTEVLVGFRIWRSLAISS